MRLIEEIEQLRSDSIAALDASHNYYTHTKYAWRIVQEMVRQGHKFSIRNRETGDSIGEQKLSSLAQGYVTNYLTSATFQHFISLFDDFVFDFLRVWLTEYPGILCKMQLEFGSVLESADKKEIIRNIILKKLNDVAYEGIEKRFKYLEEIAKLGCPNRDCLEKLAEIKASRDVLVHNKGIANFIYVKKSGERARFKDGQTLEIPDYYHRESWQLIKKIVSDIADAGIRKLKN